MRVRTLIYTSLFASLIIACSQKKKIESANVDVKEAAFYETVDDVELPPLTPTSNFKTLQDWLLDICDSGKPNKAISNYNFGLFESSDDNVIYLVGLNKYENEDTTHTRIEFEPQNMYFSLPKSEYKNLNRTQLINKVTAQLRIFANSEKFKASFLSKANAIIFEPTGQTIWSSNTALNK